MMPRTPTRASRGSTGVIALAVAIVVLVALACGAWGQLPIHSQWTGGAPAEVQTTPSNAPVRGDSGIVLGR
jgi:hypothetical protein